MYEHYQLIIICMNTARSNSPNRDSPLSVIPGGREKKKPNRLFPILLLILISGIVIILGQRGFKDVVEYDEDGNPRLTPERQTEIEQAKDKLDEAEVYLLLATYDHYIECLLCPGRRLWIKEGEIAKIGTTVNTTSRYKQAYYKKHGVEYIMYLRGSIDLVLKTEIDLLGNYPLLVENLAREEPLLFPPLNGKLK